MITWRGMLAMLQLELKGAKMIRQHRIAGTIFLAIALASPTIHAATVAGVQSDQFSY
jgi:hypothetical protein